MAPGLASTALLSLLWECCFAALNTGCGRATCNWDADANGTTDSTCGKRITWLQTEASPPFSEEQACGVVASEFAAACGGCASDANGEGPLAFNLESAPSLAKRARSLRVPVLGMNYSPDPSDYHGNGGYTYRPNSHGPRDMYFDTDFFTDDFVMLWGGHKKTGGRRDLAQMAAMGVNFIRLYNWNADQAARSGHRSFLATCASLGIQVGISLRDGGAGLQCCFFGAGCRDQDVTAENCNAGLESGRLRDIVVEASEFPEVVGMWLIGNEMDLRDRGSGLLYRGIMGAVVRKILALEDEVEWAVHFRPAISAPVSFGLPSLDNAACPNLPGGYACDIYPAMWTALGGGSAARDRLVVGMQTYNAGFFLKSLYFPPLTQSLDPNTAELSYAHRLQQAGLDYLLEVDVMLTEIGDYKQDLAGIRGQLESVYSLASRNEAPHVIGLAFFLFLEKKWKVRRPNSACSNSDQALTAQGKPQAIYTTRRNFVWTA